MSIINLLKKSETLQLPLRENMRKSLLRGAVLGSFWLLSICSVWSQTAPNISYVTPPYYLLNASITPLVPANSRGTVPALTYQNVSTFAGTTAGFADGIGTATNEVYLLMYPKFFTPNGDGCNDTWKIKFSDIEVGLTVNIFDRYGKLLKNLVTNDDSWDGTFNGDQLPADDYWFVVTRANGFVNKGHFSLKR